MGSCSSTMSRPAPAMQEAPATPKKASPSVAPVSPASTTAATPTKPSPPAARATPVSTLGAVTPKNVAVSGHCRHCKGLRGVCGCSEDCARPPSSQCRPMALEDLLTLISAAAGGGHCSHCRGASGECACSHGCPKSSSSASCYTTAVRLSVAANRINLILVVDKSGSMAGNRWTGAYTSQAQEQ